MDILIFTYLVTIIRFSTITIIISLVLISTNSKSIFILRCLAPVLLTPPSQPGESVSPGGARLSLPEAADEIVFAPVAFHRQSTNLERFPDQTLVQFVPGSDHPVRQQVAGGDF